MLTIYYMADAMIRLRWSRNICNTEKNEFV